jgi:hypothetical protein
MVSYFGLDYASDLDRRRPLPGYVTKLSSVS